MTMSEDWTKEWERRVVNGAYPLRRFLGRSNHSVVFLTECTAQNGGGAAAIKILPANPVLMDAQLEYWKTVATLSHPHLIRLLDAGRCQLGGNAFLFVVMEHAEQTLAQILPSRALTADEVRELLPPTLDALAYLHGRDLVLGGLKPPNFLVVEDQLKLASDAIRPAGERIASTAKPSLYDPPEAKKGRTTLAGDIWGLGITLVEALTQTAPTWSRERFEGVTLPADLAPEFVDPIQRCLRPEPSQRPAITELATQFGPAPPAPAPAAPPASTEAASTEAASTERASTERASTATEPASIEPAVPMRATPDAPKMPSPALAIMVGIVALAAVWGGVHLIHTHSQTTSMTPPSPPVVSPPVVPAPAAGDAPRTSIAASPPAVLHQEMPDVSHTARESIRGIIKIAVRVNVDRSGNVVGTALDNRPASKYFARAATDAAKKWKFAQTADGASEAWRLDFDFTRAGATARAVALH